jgi:hypothetical protein
MICLGLANLKKTQFCKWIMLSCVIKLKIMNPFFLHICNLCPDLFIMMMYRNPTLGLATKVKGWKVASQEGDLRVTSHALGSAKSVREWTLTLPSELPCWELESQKYFQIFRARLQGSKFIVSKSFLYHWKVIEA